MSKKLTPISGQTPETFIRAWRLKKGLTLAQIAKRIDSTVATLSRVETGQGMLTWGVINAISEAIDVPAYDLLFRDPESDDLEELFALIRKAEPQKRAFITHMLRSMLSFACNEKLYLSSPGVNNRA